MEKPLKTPIDNPTQNETLLNADVKESVLKGQSAYKNGEAEQFKKMSSTDLNKVLATSQNS